MVTIMADRVDTKFIFVVGGVVSGVGKGVAASSIGKILQSRGYQVSAIKIDPYLNVDAGTMNPTEHGEVFVLDDGMECDQDMGNYERFFGTNLTQDSYMTSGSVYLSVIQREREMGYKGKCVETVPHIPLEVIRRIKNAAEKTSAEVMIIEVGGTLGEYQNEVYFEAAKMLRREHPKDVLVVLVSYLPQLGVDSEQKTKPTQRAVRDLNAVGLYPDIVLARAQKPIDKKRKEKIAFNCGIREEDVISAPNVASIYDVPINFEKDDLSSVLLRKLSLKPRVNNLRVWKRFAETTKIESPRVRIGVVGKYFKSGAESILSDSYLSVIEALRHGGVACKIAVSLEWLNPEDPQILKQVSVCDGIVVPGGFGERGVEEKIKVIRYCREHKIPYFGLCYGMQLMVLEYARSKCSMKDAHTTEIDEDTRFPVIDILPGQKAILTQNALGGTMRLGLHPAVIEKGTVAYQAYKKLLLKNNLIQERHRHRYEVNPIFIDVIKKRGLVFSGYSPDRRLMEIAELPQTEHPFFLGTQFHPEFKSRPLDPHPLFVAFIKAVQKRKM